MRRPWWIWRTHPAPSKRMTTRTERMIGKRKRVYEDPAELMLELGYVGFEHLLLFDVDSRAASRNQRIATMPFTATTFGEIRQWAGDGLERAVYLNDALEIFERWLANHLGDRTDSVAASASYQAYPYKRFSGLWGPSALFGEMAVLNLRDIYTRTGSAIGRQGRSQRYDFLLTPPVYKFCDLTGAFSFDDIGPLEFWIQPEVHEATGEIMQGSPIGEREERDTKRRGGVGARWALTNQELQKALDGNSWATATHDESDPTQQKAAAIVRIALDSFLERGEADPRFLDPAQVYKMVDR